MNDFQNTLEYVVSMTIAAGSSAFQQPFVPLTGHIIGFKIIETGGGNPGFVNAAILDNNNKEISRFQHISNYRDRDCAYMDSFKPCNVWADGQQMTYAITATANMASTHNSQLILLYNMASTVKPDTCN